MKKQFHIVLLLILFLGLFLRVYNLRTNPPELFSDEIIIYESAKSIVEQGVDLYGNLNLYFSDRTELHPPVYGYLAYLTSLLVNDPILAIRLSATILGTFSILITYLLVNELTKKQWMGAASAFFLAVMPWHIHYSRIGWEPASLLLPLLTSILLFFKGVNGDDKRTIYVAFALFGFTFYTYQAAPLLAALILLAAVVSNYKYFIKNKKAFVIGSFIFGLMVLPFIHTLLTQPDLYSRGKRISTFSTGFSQNNLEVFADNYLEHYSWDFLFDVGDSNRRHGAGIGVLYVWMLPFMALGIVYALTKLDRNYLIFIIFWAAIFPLAGSLTNDGVPHATRTLVGAPLFAILAGIGLGFSVELITKMWQSRLIRISALLIFLAVFSYYFKSFFEKYYLEYPAESAGWWHYGNAQVFAAVKQNALPGQTVCFGNLDYWHFVSVTSFYLKERSYYEVVENPEDQKCRQSGSIVAASPDKVPTDVELIDTIYSLDGQPIFIVYRQL